MSKESRFLSRVLRHEPDLIGLTLGPVSSGSRSQRTAVGVYLGLTPIAPPAPLFQGTARDNLDAIFASGHNPGHRPHVHLSPDEKTAVKVSTRHGRPVVLRVTRMISKGVGSKRLPY